MKKFKSFIRRNFNIIAIFIGVFIAIIFPSIFLFFDAFRGPTIDANNASQYGSFIGGYIGCILSFISITFLLITFREQKLTSYYQSFENKFFEMIKLHRDNLKEAGGRKIFVNLIREFREIFSIIKDIIPDYNLLLSNKDLFDISYTVLFYGTGPNSSRELRCALKQYNASFVDAIIFTFDNRKFKKEIQKKRKFSYVPFEGHQSRLGHYFRHLYQSVCYVDNQKRLLDEEKYSYIKMLRAQLSNHEQAILFLNSLSEMGKSWNTKELIQKYSLIKNLPEDFFDKNAEINIKDIYKDLKFQWEEHH